MRTKPHKTLPTTMLSFTFRLPEDLRTHLASLAQRDRVTPSNLLRRLLYEYVGGQR